MAAPAVPVRLGHALTTAGEAVKDMGRLLAGLTVYAAAFTWAVVAVWLCFGPVAGLWQSLIGGTAVYCGDAGESHRQCGHSSAAAPPGRPADAWGGRSGYGLSGGPLLDAPALPTTGLPTTGRSSARSAKHTTTARGSSTAWPRWSGKSRQSRPGWSCQTPKFQHQRVPTLSTCHRAGRLLARAADDGLARAARARAPAGREWLRIG